LRPNCVKKVIQVPDDPLGMGKGSANDKGSKLMPETLTSTRNTPTGVPDHAHSMATLSIFLIFIIGLSITFVDVIG
jgi:hypothetical protein